MKRIHLLPTSFQNRLIIGVGLLLVLIIAVAIASLFSIQSMDKAIGEITYISSMDVGSIIKLRTLLFDVSTTIHRYLIYGNPQERELFIRLNLQVENAFDDIMLTSIAAEQKDSILSARQQWHQLQGTAKFILEAPDAETARTFTRPIEQFQLNLSSLFNYLGSLQEAVLQKAYEHQLEVQRVAARASSFIYLIFGVGISVAIIIIFLLLRSVLVPVRLLKQGANNFGKGDLSYRVPLVSGDELGELAKAFNTMAETLEKDQAALEELAIHDGLTGLYNHREFQRRLQAEIERAQRYQHRLSLLMIDIDRFKNFNDIYGHQVGDTVLQALGVKMRQEIRAVDYAARYGGEEFTIILPEMAAADAVAAAERLRKSIAADAIDIGAGQAANITVSIGVATFPEDAVSKDKLIGAADRALYAAKAAGRNKVLRAV